MGRNCRFLIDRDIDGLDNTVFGQFDEWGNGFIFHLYEIYVVFVRYTYRFDLYARQFPIFFRIGGYFIQTKITIGILAEFSGDIGYFIGFNFDFYLGFRKCISHSVIFAAHHAGYNFCLCRCYDGGSQQSCQYN